MKLYSFDLFDTLVSRKLNQPKDVFLLIEATNVVNYRNLFFKKIGFYKIRVFCEKISRIIKNKTTEDVSIYDIYKIISFFVKNPNEVMDLEVKIEKNIIYPLDFNIGILNAIKGKGKICITSDMYLPKDVIIEILSVNKIYYDYLYVSSDIGLTKATGNIFKYIADAHNIKFKDMYHYGDNEWSDVVVPSKMGINVHHVGNVKHYKSDNVFNIFSRTSQDPLYNLGYEFCGPFAYAFSGFIKNFNKEKRVVFSARDSYLFERAFNIFHNNQEVETFYTRISRKLVYIPEVHCSGNNDKVFEGSLSCDEFFKRLNLKCPDNFKGKMVWDIKQELDAYLLESNDFKYQLLNEYKIVKKYLKKHGIRSNIIFVDIGWRGSIQDSLSVIFPENNSIIGLYVGVLNNHSGKVGFIFNNKRPSKYYFYIFQALSIFEFCFTEPEYSLNTIKENNVGYDFIFTEDENITQLDKRKRIQEGAEDFFRDFRNLIIQLDLDEKYIYNSICKLIKSKFMNIEPDLINELKDLSHSAGFNGSLQSSLIEFKNFSILGYLQAPWKSYFMYELKKHSIIRYYLFSIFFHHVLFFIFYENFKVLYRKIRAFLND
ncbi:HAD-IA family hydrolase [Acinetobacter sp. HR7]|uniref:HAD-IA family hydrolase n=1 Tax=Acinetobacter sp. HR7 TaxID=1509403 RepID=UPI0005375837|nr:HAD-IA family hydrolase [Acinetobacter sp. HR7]KGT48280.1 hypothetical protein GW12_06810 [Acinetobacter sp. HR7]